MSISGKTFGLNKGEEKQKDVLDENSNLITMLYKDATNKKNQLTILSELFLKSKEEIAVFLNNHGFNDDCIKKYVKK